MKEDVILSVKGITKLFPGTKALSGVDLEVHEGEICALMGENGAGKSTLMNIITGLFEPNEGEMYFRGRKVRYKSTMEAQKDGIGIVHQELSLCQHITVAENIFMGRLPVGKRTRLVDFKQLNRMAAEKLEMFGGGINPAAVTSSLNIAQQQLVEISKALAFDCRLLILDEPTSSLTEKEIESLFHIIRGLKKQGISIIYISHRISEVFEICDSITVLRDGHRVKTCMVADTTQKDVITSMVGREISSLYPPKAKTAGEPVLEVKGLNRAGAFVDISFEVRRGEVLGFAGLIGSGRTEVARAVCGVDKKDSGEILFEGKPFSANTYGDAIKQGICYMTEDRKEQGLFLDMDIQNNISSTGIQQVSDGIFIQSQKQKALADQYIDTLNIKTYGAKQVVNNLSGGNQQKVMIGKWLAIAPKVIFMDEPTRGVDVGAKSEIHGILRNLASQGVAVVVISSELPEIVGMCDRVLVMKEGVITGEVTEKSINEKDIIMLASNEQTQQKAEVVER
ncbi:sugar ABC transporter ATP-binding protein [Christensenella timonensis]|uniref:sugar ABC transporter ATP-binding protein n=1 Tax=Christensenella timonensis TaxID=1816678 RepID=UPI00083365C9|nr:sugar ABC transporter ATP-binding protein [Christensenella timonensis]